MREYQSMLDSFQRNTNFNLNALTPMFDYSGKRLFNNWKATTKSLIMECIIDSGITRKNYGIFGLFSEEAEVHSILSRLRSKIYYIPVKNESFWKTKSNIGISRIVPKYSVHSLIISLF